MKRPFIRLEFYETYYFALCIRNILHDQFAYIRRLDDFYGDSKSLASADPFRRFSAFHRFIEFVLQEVMLANTEECDLDIRQDEAERFKEIPSALKDIMPDVLPIEHALHFHGIHHLPFVEWLAKRGKTFEQARRDDVCEYLCSLGEAGNIDALLEQAVRETFYVLFGNRQLLMLFNEMMADQIHQMPLNELDPETAKLFHRDGVLRRVAIPKWVRKAVFYRDRGLCTVCSRDLSGLLNIWAEDQYDHIVPLARGGLNDVTNIQLLCGDCNRRKSDGKAVTSSQYEDWYEMDW